MQLEPQFSLWVRPWHDARYVINLGIYCSKSRMKVKLSEFEAWQKDEITQTLAPINNIGPDLLNVSNTNICN